jgi:hypothetical protein
MKRRNKLSICHFHPPPVPHSTSIRSIYIYNEHITINSPSEDNATVWIHVMKKWRWVIADCNNKPKKCWHYLTSNIILKRLREWRSSLRKYLRLCWMLISVWGIFNIYDVPGVVPTSVFKWPIVIHSDIISTFFNANYVSLDRKRDLLNIESICPYGLVIKVLA